jgi:uncharacterized protein YbjT (DUF2867 family)
VNLPMCRRRGPRRLVDMQKQERVVPLASRSDHHPSAAPSLRGTVVVAGATGAVGAPLVTALRTLGCPVVPIARSAGVDLTTGTGLAAAMTGADTVVDVSNIITTRQRAAVAFFEQTTHRLLHAARAAGVRHYVILSIVGVDRIDYGYYHGKRAQERIIRSAELPHTILRATQFHEFAGQMLRRFQVGAAAFIPIMECRPVAAAEVADRLTEIVLAGPAARVTPTAPLEFAGPEQLSLPEMVRRFQKHMADRHLLVPVPLPGRAGRQMRAGGLLPQPGVEQGTLTFDQWLQDQPTARDC